MLRARAVPEEEVLRADAKEPERGPAVVGNEDVKFVVARNERGKCCDDVGEALCAGRRQSNRVHELGKVLAASFRITWVDDGDAVLARLEKTHACVLHKEICLTNWPIKIKRR